MTCHPIHPMDMPLCPNLLLVTPAQLIHVAYISLIFSQQDWLETFKKYIAHLKCKNILQISNAHNLKCVHHTLLTSNIWHDMCITSLEILQELVELGCKNVNSLRF